MDQSELMLDISTSLENAMAMALEQPFVFPDENCLMDEALVCPATRPECLQSGLDVYLNGAEVRTSETLILAAKALFLSSENPSVSVRCAIIRMLRDAGAYEEAILYASSFLKARELDRLFICGMPLLDKEGQLFPQLFTINGIKTDVLLAALLYHGKSASERTADKTQIAATLAECELSSNAWRAVVYFLFVALYDIGKLDDTCMQESFQVLADRTKDVSAWNDAAQLLLKHLNGVPEPLLIAPQPSLSAWLSRYDEFDQLYREEERHGWFVWDPDDNYGCIWCGGNMAVYPLTLVECDDLGAKWIRICSDIRVPPICFRRDEDGHIHSAQIMTASNDYLKNVSRLKKLLRYGGGVELARVNAILDKSKKNPVPHIAFRFYLRELEKSSLKKEKAEQLIEEMKAVFPIVDAEERALAQKAIVNFCLSNEAYDILRRFAKQSCAKESGSLALLMIDALSKGIIGPHTLNWRSEWSPKRLRMDECYSSVFYQFQSPFAQGSHSEVRANVLEKDRLKAERIEKEADEEVNYKNKAELYLYASYLFRSSQSYADGPDRANACMIRGLWNKAKANELSDKPSRELYLFLLNRCKRDLAEKDEELKELRRNAEYSYFEPFKNPNVFSLKEVIIDAAQNRQWGSIVADILTLSLFDYSVLEEESPVLEAISHRSVQNKIREKIHILKIDDTEEDETLAFVRAIQNYREELAALFEEAQLALRNAAEDTDAFPVGQVKELLGGRKYHMLFSILSERSGSDKDLFRKLSELLERFSQVTGGKQLPDIMQLIVDSRNFNKRLREDHALCVRALLGDMMNAMIKHLEKAELSIKKTLRPTLEVEPLYAETTQNESYRIYFRIKCGNSNAAKNVFVSLPKCADKMLLCQYVSPKHNGYGYLEMPCDMRTADESMFAVGPVEFSFQAAATEEQLKQSFGPFNQRYPERFTGNYKQVYDFRKISFGINKDKEPPFFGREDELDNICEQICEQSGMIHLIWGEMRVGKSSLAEHILNRLKNKSGILVAERQNIDSYSGMKNDHSDKTDKEICNFLFRCLLYISNAFSKPEYLERAEYLQKERDVLETAKKALKEMSSASEGQVVFKRAISELLQGFQREEHWKETHILLCFDEFQNYYNMMRDGILDRRFIDFLKSFQESGLGISLVLTGTELMMPFFEEYWSQNVSAVIDRHKVEYLKETHAKQLISTPIPTAMGSDTPNPFRYVVDELFHLTAGSPMLIQMLCSLLIKKLNMEGKTYVSMDMVNDLICSNTIGSEMFNHLNNPEDLPAGADPRYYAPQEDTKDVLRKVAERYVRQSKGESCTCTLDDLQSDLPEMPLASNTIEELCKRNVLLRENDEYRIRVPLYALWLYAHPE